MSTPASGVYTVDPSRSTITFTTKHMFGLGTVVGAFAVQTAQIAERNGELTAKATASIDRYAHGVTAMKGMAGRRLDLVFDITAVASDRESGRTATTRQARG